MNEPDAELVETLKALGIEHDPLTGIRGRRPLSWAELDTAYLQRIRSIMGNDAPEALLDELRRRGLTDAA